MSDNTEISWSDATWNVVIGCDKVSPGCDHCYAIRTAHRMQANPNEKVSSAYAGTEADGEWTGQVNLIDRRLDMPLRWRDPRRIFVNAQSDLFHKNVPDEFIARVWAVMALANQHTFQILTKRPGRMRSLLSDELFRTAVLDEAYDMWDGRVDGVTVPATAPVSYRSTAEALRTPGGTPWPLPNVWLGVSVEDQKRADLRIPALLGTPATVRFLSCEPLLGAVDLRKAGALASEPVAGHCIDADMQPWHDSCAACGTIDWVIVGGESGPGARPMHPDWARKLRDQCYWSGVPFHFKQWGEFVATKTWPWVDHAEYERVGKKRAGRELDGRTWDQFPEAVGAR